MFTNFHIDNTIIKQIIALLSFIFAIIFAMLGIFTEPEGVLDASVNILIAQMLILCCTMLGLKIDFDLKERHMKTGEEQKTE